MQPCTGNSATEEERVGESLQQGLMGVSCRMARQFKNVEMCIPQTVQSEKQLKGDAQNWVGWELEFGESEYYLKLNQNINVHIRCAYKCIQ